MNPYTKFATTIGLASLMALPGYMPAFGQIDELVVTARKREELIQDVPLSITAFTSDAIALNNIINVRDLTNFVPGFEFVQGSTREFERPVIRGQSNIFGESGVSFFVNGIFFDGSISTIDLSEVERLEVIRGPQSALFGRNTYSGAVNITTKQPGDEFRANFSATGAEHGQYEVTAGLSGPIVSGVLSGGVYLRHYEYDGEHKNAFDGKKVGDEESDSISATLRLTPSDTLDITLRGVYAKDDDGPPAMFLQPPSVNNAFFTTPGPDPFGEYFIGEIKPRAVDNDMGFVVDPGFEQERFEVSLAINWDLSDAFAMTSITGFQDIEQQEVLDFDHQDTSVFTPIPVFMFPTGGPPFPVPWIAAVVPILSVSDSIETDETISQELRFDYDDGGRFRAMVGGYYYRNVDELTDRFDATALSGHPLVIAAVASAFADPGGVEGSGFLPGELCTFLAALCSGVIGPLNFSEDGRSIAKTITRDWAIFGSFEIDLTDRLTARIEARYQEENIDFKLQSVALGVITDTVDDTFTSFSPRFTINYDLTDNSLLYVVAANGSKPGGVNGASGFDVAVMKPTFGEEEIWSYEIGTKNTFFDGQLILNLAGYYSDIKDYQLTESVVRASGDTEAITINKGKARVYGIELQSIWTPDAVPGATLNLSYAFNDSEFKSGATDTTQGVLDDILDDGMINCSLGDDDPGAGCTSIATSIAGQRLPRSSKHQLSAGVDYRQPLMGNVDIDWFVGANVAYNSPKFVQVHNLAEYGEATLVNVSLGIAGEHFSLTAWGKNIFDEDSTLSASRFTDFSNFERAYFANLRRGSQWGGTLRVNF